MIRPAIILLCLAASARADGIGTSLMQVPPCWATALEADDIAATFVIVEDAPDQVALARANNAGNCFTGPMRVKWRVADYRPEPGQWWQPPPLPSPVPLPASALLLSTAILALTLKRKMR